MHMLVPVLLPMLLPMLLLMLLLMMLHTVMLTSFAANAGAANAEANAGANACVADAHTYQESLGLLAGTISKGEAKLPSASVRIQHSFQVVPSFIIL